MGRTRAVTAIATVGAAAALIASAHADNRHSPRATPARGNVTVKFGEYFYRPKRITINRGASIRFLNVGKIEHTVADSTKSGTVRAMVIHPRPLEHGASQTVTFRKSGTVYYLCTFHPQLMRGVVVVR